MTQAERDRLVALKKAKKKLITQKQAAEELGITERHVRRLLRELKRRGDKVVAHGLRGLPSNRKISADTEQEAVAILSRPVYRGFGPTLASEYLAKKHDIEVSRETVRQWMMGAKLWRARPSAPIQRLRSHPRAAVTLRSAWDLWRGCRGRPSKLTTPPDAVPCNRPPASIGSRAVMRRRRLSCGRSGVNTAAIENQLSGADGGDVQRGPVRGCGVGDRQAAKRSAVSSAPQRALEQRAFPD